MPDGLQVFESGALPSIASVTASLTNKTAGEIAQYCAPLGPSSAVHSRGGYDHDSRHSMKPLSHRRMKYPVIHALSVLCMLCSGCTAHNIILLRASLPVVTTLELRNSPKAAPIGKLVGVGGVITACDVSRHVVILDNVVECVDPVGQGEALDNLMRGYSTHIGVAAAIRGRLTRSRNSPFPYVLTPYGYCIDEVSEVRRKLTEENKFRPGLRFAAYYGWAESSLIMKR